MREFARFLGKAISLLAVVVAISIPLSKFSHAAGGEIFYESPGFDLANTTFKQSKTFAYTPEGTPTGMTFNDDGTKMYVVGLGNDKIEQYTLHTAYNVTTASFVQSFSVGSQDLTPQDVTFNSDGSKMYMIGATSDKVNEYDLSNEYDISTASFVHSYSIVGKEQGAGGVTFSPDGTKMYIVGSLSDSVHEYSLSTPDDISSATFVRTKSVSAQETSSTDMSFNGDGTKMYVIGSASDRINQYNLSTAYNISTATYSTFKSISSQDASSSGMAFNSTGSKVYMIGTSSDSVHEYNNGTNYDVSTATYSQSFLINATSANSQGITLNSDGTKLFAVSAMRDSVDEYTLSTAHDISTATMTQTLSIYSQETSASGIAFSNDGSKMFISGDGTNGVIEYSLSTNFDISTATYTNNFAVGAQETSLMDVSFSSDGSKMYIIGQASDSVHRYTLSTPYDTTTASYSQSFSIATEENTSTGVTFNANGSAMFVSGSTNDKIYKYSLSTNFDISTASYSSIELSVTAQDSNAHGIAFSQDGKKMYMIGSTLGKVSEYDSFNSTPNGFNENTINNGSVDGQLIFYIEGDTFQDTDNDDVLDVGSEVTLGGLPSGISADIYLSEGDTVGTVLLSGQAVNHENEDSVSDITFQFSNSAFTGGDANSITNATGPASSGAGISFIDGYYLKTSRQSLKTDGSQGDNYTWLPSISDSRRYVAFMTYSSMDSTDDNIFSDVYLRDTVTEETRLISEGIGNIASDADAYDCMISGDGRYIVFTSWAGNLVPGDTNGLSDVFLYDVQNETLERVSKDTGGGEINGAVAEATISDDGRYITYTSGADNIIASDTNGIDDIFLYDTQTDTTNRVSVDSLGAESDNSSSDSMISGDGQHIVYASYASNLVASDTNSALDVFHYNVQTQTTTRVSVSTSGTQSASDSQYPSINHDGTYITFMCGGSELVTGDTNYAYDIFLRNTQTSTTSRVTVDSSDNQFTGQSYSPSSISDDGRYIVYASDSYNAVTGDSNNVYDIILRDTQQGTTHLMSLSTGNVNHANSASEMPYISSDGKYIVYTSAADNLVVGDTNGANDIFMTTFTTRNRLLYTAGTGGSVVGDNSQDIEYGEDGSAVSAVANSGYSFIGWSDSSTENPRIDTNVTANISVTANFEKNPEVPSTDIDGTTGGGSSTTAGSSGEYTGYTPDADSVPNDIEDAAPNGGDANNDGLKDSLQSNVASFVNSTTGKYSVLEVNSECVIQSIIVSPESKNTSQDESSAYPFGLMDFTVKCKDKGQSSKIVQYYYTDTDAKDLEVKKYSKTSDKYKLINNSTITQLNFSKNNVIKASYSATDGGKLDEDGYENKVIVDPSGPARNLGGISGSNSSSQPRSFIEACMSYAWVLYVLLAVASILVGYFSVQKKNR